MLQNIRDNAQGTIAKIIVFLIVLTFAFWGVESIIGNMSGEPNVAEVNGVGIKDSRFTKAVEQKRRQILGQMGDAADPSLIDDGLLRKSVLEGLIEEQILVQWGEGNGQVVSSALIDQYIRALPVFQTDGSFDQDRYASTLRALGLLPGDFRDAIKNELLIAQGREAIRQSATLTSAELSNLIRLDRQTRDYDYFVIKSNQFSDDLNVSEEEAADYYDTHKSEFRLPERVSVQYLLLRKSDIELNVSVTDDEVKKRYEQELATFGRKEERDASHILIEVSDENPDEKALEKISSIRKELEGGTDFSALAKKYSQDPGSASQGGHLGYVTKGIYTPEFDEALFGMKQGEVSQPVKTQYGYHLIRLDGVRQQEPPSLMEMKDQLLATLRSEKAENLYVEKAEKLADVTYSAGDLSAPAKELGMKVQESDLFSRDSGKDLFANPKVVSAAFSDDVLGGNNSEPIEVSKEETVVLHLKQHLDAEEQSLENVKSLVQDRVLKMKAMAAAQKAGEEAIGLLNDGGAPQEIVSKYAGGWDSIHAGTRGQSAAPAEVVKKAFSMPRPVEKLQHADGVSLGQDGYAVIVLKSVKDGAMESYTDAERKTIKGLVEGNQGNREYSIVTEYLRQNAEIKRI